MRSGPSEIFRGAVASSLRDAPYAGIFVVFYEHIKSTLCALPRYHGTGCSIDGSLCPAASAVSSAPNSTVVGVPFSLSTSVNSLAAASAGALATLATQPFDVMKTKMQVRSETVYHGLWSTVRAVWLVWFLLGCRYWNTSLTTGYSIGEWPVSSTARRSGCLEKYSAQRSAGLCMRAYLWRCTPQSMLTRLLQFAL